MSIDKAKLYRTAYATVSCAHFEAGQCVALSNPWRDASGKMWFDIAECDHGKLPGVVSYPENHLERFCL